MNTAPESEYTQAEAYEPMEAAVADAVEALSNFPGFGQRSWSELPCSRNGVDDSDYTSIEITYQFSSENSESELVRQGYVDELRDYWTSLGYEITSDESKERASGRIDHDLVAKRDDGITLWYSVWDISALIIQSGCVPVSDASEIEYIAPSGGIEPGGEGDLVAKDEDYFPDGIPTDEAAAVDPFANTQAAASSAQFDSPANYEGLL